MIKLNIFYLFVLVQRGISQNLKYSSIDTEESAGKFDKLIPDLAETNDHNIFSDVDINANAEAYLKLHTSTSAPFNEVVPTNEPAEPTNTPTTAPTNAPTDIQAKETDTPTENPTTLTPTVGETSYPTSYPTYFVDTVTPTASPVADTQEPTNTPTIAYKEYPYMEGFNYRPSSRTGPERWYRVDVDGSEYFQYFDDERNECRKREQSPIDIDPRGNCPDDHKINYKSGRPKFETLDFRILPYVLRAHFFRPEMDPDDEDAIYLGTRSDYSNLSSWIPAVHVDVKVPSEHTLFGRRYAGEMNIVHFWDNQRGRLVSITILMDDDDDEFNEQLELFIREWEEEAIRKTALCNGEKYTRTYFPPGEQEMKRIWNLEQRSKTDWDVYSFVTTIFYCGYRGSLTVPPCSQRVVYRVLDLPMKMSKTQTERLRSLLLDQLDDDCREPNISFRGEVSRPLQDNDNRVYCCTSEDWPLKWNQEYWLNRWPKSYHGRDNIVDPGDDERDTSS